MRLFYSPPDEKNIKSQAEADAKRKAASDADKEWANLGKPTAEERAANKQERLTRAINRAFNIEEK